MKLDAENAFMKTSAKICSLSIALALLCPSFTSFGQEAVGEWRFHLSYSQSNKLVGSKRGSLFTLGKNGLFYYSGPNAELDELTRLDGISTQNFQAFAFDDDSNQLLVAHQNGVIDFVSERNVIPFFGLSENEFVPNKNINSFSRQDEQIWVAGDFGFAEIDLRNRILKDSYLNLGPSGSAQPIFGVAKNESNTYLASGAGIRFASNSSNLKDFRSWQTIPNTREMAWEQILIVSEAQFALSKSGELFEFNQGGIQQIFGLAEVSNLKSQQSQIYFQQGNAVFSLDEEGDFREIFNSEESFVDFWVDEGQVTILLPSNGILLPSSNVPLVFPGPVSPSFGVGHLQNQIISLPASYESDRTINSSSIAKASFLSEGIWQEIPSPDSITTAITWQNEGYFGTTSGLWVQRASGALEQIALPGGPDNLPISALATDARGGLWVGVFDQISRVFELSSEGIRSVDVPGLLLPRSIITDLQSRLWIIQANRFGRTLRLFFPETGQSRSFGQSNSLGGLPDDQVFDMYLDQRDRLWLATARGIAFLPSASLIESNTNLEGVRPLINGSPVFSGQEILSLAQSPDQTFFAGTRQSGLWHFSEDFDEVLQTYTPSNSPLPDRQIVDLQVDGTHGQLFVLCPQGLISIRTGIKEPFPNLEALKIFPNPVQPDFNGLLTIEGLVEDSDLLITDTSGKPVYRTFAKGGSITWNLQDRSGGRLTTGVYLVYVFDPAGRQRAAGKFLVI